MSCEDEAVALDLEDCVSIDAEFADLQDARSAAADRYGHIGIASLAVGAAGIAMAASGALSASESMWQAGVLVFMAAISAAVLSAILSSRAMRH